jgi:hypothetical protein
MTGATSGTGTGDPSGINIVPSPNTFNVGVTTITYTITDSNNNTATCSFTVTILAKPEITCLPPVTYNTDPGLCTHNVQTADADNPGVPVLNSGVQPIIWTWTITNPDSSFGATGTSTTTNASPIPDNPGPYDFQLGTSTILWHAENISGFDECTQEVIVEDHEDPTFTPPTYTDCVDMLQSAVYSATNPNPNAGIDPNLIKDPSPDYSTLESGNTALDLTNLADNCCDPSSLIINWRIDFTDVPDPLNPSGPALSHASIPGTGQPSTYGSDILLWGDGVNFTTVTHLITYTVEDCNGNITDELTRPITITPRPRITKMN